MQKKRMATSTLNPDAPIFVPLAYRAVEDFSHQWWDLVQSSPWFRDYWLQECFDDDNDLPFDPPFSDIYDPALPDFDFLFDDNDVSAVTNDDNYYSATTTLQRKWNSLNLQRCIEDNLRVDSFIDSVSLGFYPSNIFFGLQTNGAGWI